MTAAPTVQSPSQIAGPLVNISMVTESWMVDAPHQQNRFKAKTKTRYSSADNNACLGTELAFDKYNHAN